MQKLRNEVKSVKADSGVVWLLWWLAECCIDLILVIIKHLKSSDCFSCIVALQWRNIRTVWLLVFLCPFLSAVVLKAWTCLHKFTNRHSEDHFLFDALIFLKSQKVFYYSKAKVQSITTEWGWNWKGTGCSHSCSDVLVLICVMVMFGFFSLRLFPLKM